MDYGLDWGNNILLQSVAFLVCWPGFVCYIEPDLVWPLNKRLHNSPTTVEWKEAFFFANFASTTIHDFVLVRVKTLFNYKLQTKFNVLTFFFFYFLSSIALTDGPSPLAIKPDRTVNGCKRSFRSTEISTCLVTDQIQLITSRNLTQIRNMWNSTSRVRISFTISALGTWCCEKNTNLSSVSVKIIISNGNGDVCRMLYPVPFFHFRLCKSQFLFLVCPCYI